MSKAKENKVQQINIVSNSGKSIKYPLLETITLNELIDIVNNNCYVQNSEKINRIINSKFTINYPTSVIKKIEKSGIQNVKIALTTTRKNNVLIAIPFVTYNNKNLRITAKNVNNISKKYKKPSTQNKNINSPTNLNIDNSNPKYNELKIPINLFVLDVLDALKNLNISYRDGEGLSHYDLKVKSFGISAFLRLDVVLSLLKLGQNFPLDCNSNKIDYASPVFNNNNKTTRWILKYSTNLKATIDHIFPVSLEGKTSLYNLQLMREDLNVKKGNIIPKNLDNPLNSLIILNMLNELIDKQIKCNNISKDKKNILLSLQQIVDENIADTKCVLLSKTIKENMHVIL